MVQPPPGGTPPNDGSEASLDPEDWDAFRARAHEMLDELIDHVRDVRQRPVWRPIPPEVRERISTRPLPSEPRPPEQIWAEVRETMLPYSTGNIHPRFWGWVHGSGTPVGIVAEMITAAMNANLGGREHMPVHVERRVVAWFRDLLGLPTEASGLMVTGTSMGTLIALKVARDSAAEVREKGLAALGRQMVVYVSSEAHISARKAAELLGLGAAGVRVVPTDAHFRMDVVGLEQQIRADREAGVLPLCVIATAGTVNTGAIDDLAALADLCEANDLWLHAAGFAGSHVVIRNPDRVEVPRDVVRRAAELAVFHSKAREARGKVDVHVCRAGDVRVAGERVADEDRVVPGSVELAPGLVGEGHLREPPARLQMQRTDVDERAAPRPVLGAPRATGRDLVGLDAHPWAVGDRAAHRPRSAVVLVHQCCSPPTVLTAEETASAACRPVRRSARMSSMCSRPTASRTSPGLTPAAASAASSSWECVVEAGWITRERTSPMLATLECSARASPKAMPAS